MSETEFKLATINALRASGKSADIQMLLSVRESIKTRDLKAGDIVINVLSGRAEVVRSIENRPDCYLVELAVKGSVDGGQFTLEKTDRIDVYRADKLAGQEGTA